MHKPVLRTHDSRGYRVDEVDFHPSWHALMTTAIGRGLHAAPWADSRPGAHAARAAGFMVWTQAEAGHGCPVSMTYACVPALRHAPELAARYEPLLTATSYDFGLRPPQQKTGLLAGMAMTEKQGGSDVRANTTTAVPAGDGSYLLTGHKWFCSAPMCDLFLVLAQAPQGLTCFLLPRVLPDGSRNAMHIQRLKDKLGNSSNASSRGGVRPGRRVAGRRAGPGRCHDHQHGQRDPAGLRARQHRRHPAGDRAGRQLCQAASVVRQAAHRPSGHGCRASPT